jgi:hypothetical protein
VSVSLLDADTNLSSRIATARDRQRQSGTSNAVVAKSSRSEPMPAER